MIRFEQVTKRYPNGHLAVDELSLEVAEGEVCVLVGPSGCGKTTTMKMVNRLVEPTSGRIVVGGDDVTKVDPVQLRRRIGYVIQQIGLFPHLNVADNVGCVPHLLGWNKRRLRARVDELLELVGLDPPSFRGRYPDQLSGGQRQRVGVARALAADPPVMLMDEPFGAIDPVTRERLQDEFLRLQAEVGKTVVFVTHDIDEAVRLGDRIAVLAEGGVLEQYDTPAEILTHPASPFVAGFVGADRGLKRLRVLGVREATLVMPPTVGLHTLLSEARHCMSSDGTDFVLVIDPLASAAEDRSGPDGNVVGFLHRTEAAGDGTVAGRLRPLEAWVSADATLAEVLSAMLLSDTGWVAVLDEQRLRGVVTAGSLYATLRHS